MTAETRKCVDFHVHIDPVADRIESARQLFEVAQKRGVVAMAVLMRSEIPDELPEIIELGREMGISVFSGVEYQVGVDGKSAGVVCLGFDCNDPLVQRYFGQEVNREENRERAERQRAFLISKGFSFEQIEMQDREMLSALLGGNISEKAIHFCEIVARNPENSDFVENLKRQDAELWQQVWSKYFEMPNFIADPRKLEGKFLYLKYFDFGKEGYEDVLTQAEKIVEAIHGASGVVLYSPEGDFDIEVWEKFQNIGVDGIMGWHGSQLGRDGKSGEVDIPMRVIKSARKNGLLILGGSDFQGKDWRLGDGNGEMFISVRRYGELVEFIEERRDSKQDEEAC
jgi:hypothetical protein